MATTRSNDMAAFLRALNPVDPVRELCTQIYNDHRESPMTQIELMMLACHAGQMRQLTATSAMIDRLMPDVKALPVVKDWQEEDIWDRKPNTPLGEPDAIGDDLRAMARELNR